MLYTEVRTGRIGPEHDPYGTMEVIAKDGTKKACYYADGLGECRLELTDGTVVVRKFEWFNCYNRRNRDQGDKGAIKAFSMDAKAHILFKRFIGITVDEVKADWDRITFDEPQIWID